MTERIQRFMLFYALMTMVLIGVRFVTKDTDKQLADLQLESADLIAERSEVQLQLANLESAARVRRWAFSNNMIPFSSATALILDFKPLKAVPAIAQPEQKITVQTKWR